VRVKLRIAQGAIGGDFTMVQKPFPVTDRKRLVDFVSRHRSWFEKTIELAPESDEAKRSRTVIDQLR